MTTTYNAVETWLRTHAGACTSSQLQHLSELLRIAMMAAQQREANSQEALEKLEALAREQGFAGVDDLLKQARGEAARRSAPPPGRQPRSELRKPFLDPLDPDTKELYALSKTLPENYPAWVKRALERGFTLDELRYKNHAAACRRLGLTPLYDAQDKFNELAKATPLGYRP